MSSSWIGREATRRLRHLVRIDTIRSTFRISLARLQDFFRQDGYQRTAPERTTTA
jgi:hypothetical protein